MWRKFYVPTSFTTTTSAFTSAGILISAATVRPAIFEFDLGTEGAPAENTVVYLLQRTTTTTTFTAVTPVPIDPTDGVLTNPVSLTTAGSNATVEPTYTAAQNLFGSLGINQRATYRWIAAPGGELLLPAVAAKGAGFQVKSAAYTGATDVDWYFQE